MIRICRLIMRLCGDQRLIIKVHVKGESRMNSQDLEQRIADIETNIAKIMKLFAAFNIDKQQFVKGNKIVPGIGIKVAYNADGLILSSGNLETNDIPQLPIDKINGLESVIDSKASINDVQEMRNNLANMYNHTSTTQTGCKVNVDEHGFVNNVSDLNVDDIPQLPISKINGLIDALNEAKSCVVKNTNDEYNINAGTGCKITYDEHGRVVSKSELSINDIPSEIITRLNNVESIMLHKADQSAVDIIANNIRNKIDSNASTNSGIFTKVIVDANGLVTKGESLTKNDLPRLNIDDIESLRQTLANMLSLNDLDEINSNINDVRTVVSTRLTSDDIKGKADNDTLHSLELRVTHVEELMNNVIEKIPGDMILKQLEQLSADISTISGRVALIERTLSANEN